ncbi:DeoR family transcriptional regulator, partial [Streptococcus sp. DD11]
MRKQERLDEIVNLVNKTGTIYVQDIMETMNVSDM